MSNPHQGFSSPPDPGQHVGYQYPPPGPPGQYGPPPWQGPPAPKQSLAARIASALDSWQKVVIACTAFIAAIGGLVAAVHTSHPTSSAGGASGASSMTGSSGIQTLAPTQTSSTAGSSGIQIPVPTRATGLPAGCQQGLAAIATFEQTAESTPSNEQNAAQRAAYETDTAESGASGVVALDLQNLGNDFLNLYVAALTTSDFSSQGSAFSTELAQINVDSQQLEKDCKTA